MKDNYSRRDWLRVIRDIYKLKIIQVFTVLIILIIVLYVLEGLGAENDQGIWVIIRKLPLHSLADAAITALLVGFAYEWIVRRESEATLVELISEQINSQKNAILEEIPRSLLVSPEVVESVLKREKVDDIIRTGLQISLGDTQMGTDIYEGLLRKTLSYSERWSNYRFKVALSTIRDDACDEAIRSKFYDATVDMRYDTRLTRTSLNFRCVNTIEDYNKAIRDPENEFTWLFPPADEFSANDPKVFDIEAVTINNIELDISRKPDKYGNIVIESTHPETSKLLGQICTVYYRYLTKINKRGHLFMANVTVPTKNVVYELDYAETDIHYVNVLDFFLSPDVPKITYVPSKAKAHKIEVELSGWVFPKGGVAFVWVLQKEMNATFLSPVPAGKRGR